MRIRRDLTIDEAEIDIAATRSSGPGGQHVNKSETKVVLSFDIAHSRSLSPEQKDRLRMALGHRMTHDGRLRLASQRHRSRALNEREVRHRFADLIRRGLETAPPRRATGVPRSQRRRRLEAKRRRSRIKQLRSNPRGDGESS